MRGKFREVNKEAQNWVRKAIMRIIIKLDRIDEKTEKTTDDQQKEQKK